MHAVPPHFPSTIAAWLFAAATAALAALPIACGLSASGLGAIPSVGNADDPGNDASAPGTTGSAPSEDGGDATSDASSRGSDATVGPTGPIGSSDASLAGDTKDSAAPSPTTDGSDDGAAVPPACTAFDGGIGGALALGTFTVEGNASYNENGDGRITLTNSSNSQSGAAWYPTTMPAGIGGYDLTWTTRQGPDDTAGDGFTFAVLASPSIPGVGSDGSGLGLEGIGPASGGAGVLSGYAVALDTYQDDGDPTDVAPVTLKLVKMPGFQIVAYAGVGASLNDGNVYGIDVSWSAPSSLTATFHEADGGVVTISSSDPGLSVGPGAAYLGFTAATGSASNTHNEIAGITVATTCE
jgi:hypothetical protein